MEGVWSAEDTTASAIEDGLRDLLLRRQLDSDRLVPARVMNLVAVVDREWRGEVENRLERVGRYHPSRLVICAVEPRRTTIDAWATVTTDEAAGLEGAALAHERVEIMVGPQHLPNLHTIVDPLVVTDLATMVWSPHRHDEAVDSLIRLAQVVLLDSVDVPEPREALARADELAERAYVVDLAWLRSTPWRERISASFDPPAFRSGLRSISSIEVRHRADSSAAALLLVGWLSSRLGWRPGSLVARNGALYGRATGPRQEIAVRLESSVEQDAPGLAGITIETAGGMALSLDRGPGGLTARRRKPDGSESSWTVLGASRGESGILGEGIRQALLRGPTYRPAVACG